MAYANGASENTYNIPLTSQFNGGGLLECRIDSSQLRYYQVHIR